MIARFRSGAQAETRKKSDDIWTGLWKSLIDKSIRLLFYDSAYCLMRQIVNHSMV